MEKPKLNKPFANKIKGAIEKLKEKAKEQKRFADPTEDFEGFEDSENFEDFDPSGAIINEKKKNTRGVFISNGVGKSGTISLNVIANKSNKDVYELFNVNNSIVSSPNDTIYNANAYRPQPVSTSFILKHMAYLAVAPEGTPLDTALSGSENGSWLGMVALFNDNSGALETRFYSYPRFYVNSDTNETQVQCSQRSYRSLFFDIQSGLTLHVKKMKIIYTENVSPEYPAGVPYWREIYNQNLPAQVAESLIITKYGTFGENSITIQPAEYIDPKNPRKNVIEIDKQFFIDKHTAIYSTLLPACQAQIIFEVDMYRNNGLGTYGTIIEPKKTEPKQLLPNDKLTAKQKENLKPIDLNQKGENNKGK